MPSVSRTRRPLTLARISSAASSAAGAMMTSVKISDTACAAARIERPVEGDDAAERADRIGPQRQPISLSSVAATAAPQGLACFTITQAAAACRIELGDAFEGRIGIVDVVVGELLALHLAGPRHARPAFAGGVEGGPSAAGSRRSAAVDTSRPPIAAHRSASVAGPAGEIMADRGIIGGGTGKCLGGERLAQGSRHRAAGLAQRLEHRGIIGRIDDRPSPPRCSWPLP